MSLFETQTWILWMKQKKRSRDQNNLTWFHDAGWMQTKHKQIWIFESSQNLCWLCTLTFVNIYSGYMWITFTSMIKFRANYETYSELSIINFHRLDRVEQRLNGFHNQLFQSVAPTTTPLETFSYKSTQEINGHSSQRQVLGFINTWANSTRHLRRITSRGF